MKRSNKNLTVRQKGAGAGDDAPGQAGGFPLGKLEEIIMTIDWEVTDEHLDAYAAEVRALQYRYQADQTISACLKILVLLGSYIKGRKANVHPRAYALLFSTFESLKEIINTAGLSEREKKNRVTPLVREYKKLRSEVSTTRRAPAASECNTPAGFAPTDKPGSLTAQSVAQALLQLNKTMEDGFNRLLAAIKDKEQECPR